MRGRIQGALLGLVGGVAGGAAGDFLFFWLARQGLYGLIIPGALLGLGCALLSRARSLTRGVVCGLAGLGLGLFVEWKFSPFLADGGFVYLLTHVHKLQGATQLMIVVGGVLAFWLGKDPGLGSFAGPRKAGPPAD